MCDGTSATGESRHRIPGASVGQPTEPCLVVVGRLRIVLVHDLPLQVVVNGVAARQVHAIWSRLDPWRGQLPPADVTACAGRRRIVAASSTTSIAPSFSWAARRHGRIGAYCASNRLLSPGYLAAFAPGNEKPGTLAGRIAFLPATDFAETVKAPL